MQGCGWVERKQIPWELKGVARIQTLTHFHSLAGECWKLQN